MTFDFSTFATREETALLAGLGLVGVYLVVSWLRDRVHARRLEVRGREYRGRIYGEFHVTMWGLAGIMIALWLASGRSLSALGFEHAPGWGLLAAWALTVAAALYLAFSFLQIRRSPQMLAEMREQLEEGGGLDLLKPETPRQARSFHTVSLTAGITEEIVCRGFVIGALAVFMPLWLAAPLSVVLFVAGHAYQGVRGAARILPISVMLTVLFVMSGSLWPGMVLHTVFDMAGGAMMWQVARTRTAGAPVSAPS